MNEELDSLFEIVELVMTRLDDIEERISGIESWAEESNKWADGVEAKIGEVHVPEPDGCDPDDEPPF